jgi:acyl transferase domain-containing protein
MGIGQEAINNLEGMKYELTRLGNFDRASKVARIIADLYEIMAYVKERQEYIARTSQRNASESPMSEEAKPEWARAEVVHPAPAAQLSMMVPAPMTSLQEVGTRVAQAIAASNVEAGKVVSQEQPKKPEYIWAEHSWLSARYIMELYQSGEAKLYRRDHNNAKMIPTPVLVGTWGKIGDKLELKGFDTLTGAVKVGLLKALAPKIGAVVSNSQLAEEMRARGERESVFAASMRSNGMDAGDWR